MKNIAMMCLCAAVLAGCKKDAAPESKAEPIAEEPTAEQPKAEEPTAEEPKAEEPKAEEPKVEEPKAEEPKAEEPKAEEPKAEEPSKTEEPGSLTVLSVRAGAATTCALMSDKTVRCWGGNKDAVFQTGGTRVTPHLVEGTDGAAALFGGTSESTTSMSSQPQGGYDYDTWCVAVGPDVKCWGASGEVLLGEKATGPTVIPKLAELSSITFAYGTGCGVKADGTAWCWGDGPLGDGTNNDSDEALVQVKDAKDVKEIQCGQLRCCYRNGADDVYCWGDDAGDYTASDLPVKQPKAAKQLAVGTNSLCTLAEDGIVSCGPNGFQLEPIGGSLKFKSIVGGRRFCGVTSGDEVACWLGNAGDSYDATPHHEEAFVARLVPATKGAVSASVGEAHNCALMADGGVTCWGSNHRGQLGNGTLTNSSSAAAVSHMKAPQPPTVAAPSAVPEKADWADLPARCTAGVVEITYEGKPAGRMALFAGHARPADGALEIWISDAAVGERADVVDALLRGAQQMIVLNFGGPDGSTIKKGRVTTNRDKKRYASVKWAQPDTSKSADDDAKGSVKITHLDKAWVCGTMDLTDEDGLGVKGPFAARMLPAY